MRFDVVESGLDWIVKGPEDEVSFRDYGAALQYVSSRIRDSGSSPEGAAVCLRFQPAAPAAL